MVATFSFCVIAKPKDSSIEKVVFVHYSVDAKPTSSAAAKILDEGYKTFRGGIKWPGANPDIQYFINTDSIPSGIDTSAAITEITSAFETSDAETSVDLFNNSPSITIESGANRDYMNIVS